MTNENQTSPKEKSIWQKLGLVKDDEATPQTPAQINTPQTTPVTTGVIATETANTLSVGVPDEKILQKLSGVLDAANIPGQDYYEFRKAVDSMSNVPMDEKSKFLATYSVLSTQGCTKDVLLSSIDTYIGVIQKEQLEFEQGLQAKYEEKVQRQIDAIEKAKAKVTELQTEILKINEGIATATAAAQEENFKLTQLAANFKKSAEVVLKRLSEDKEKINLFIQ